MTITTIPHVIAKDGALDRAINAQRTTLRALADAVGGSPSRATISNVAGKPGYGIAKDKAQRIADALGLPIGDLFEHKDGAPLA